MQLRRLRSGRLPRRDDDLTFRGFVLRGRRLSPGNYILRWNGLVRRMLDYDRIAHYWGDIAVRLLDRASQERYREVMLTNLARHSFGVLNCQRAVWEDDNPNEGASLGLQERSA